MGYKRLERLDEPWYGKQPGESPTAYKRFLQYRQQRRGRRSYEQVAEEYDCKADTIRHQAKALRWEDRVAAWDEEQSRRHDEVILAHAEMLAEEQISTATEMMRAARVAVREHITAGESLDPGEVARWADTASKISSEARQSREKSRAVYRQAAGESSAAGGDGGGGTLYREVEIPEFSGLSSEGKRQRIEDIVSSLARFDAYEQREQDEGGV